MLYSLKPVQKFAFYLFKKNARVPKIFALEEKSSGQESNLGTGEVAWWLNLVKDPGLSLSTHRVAPNGL